LIDFVDFCFCSGGWDNTVQFWDIRFKILFFFIVFESVKESHQIFFLFFVFSRVGKPVRSIFGPHICGDALDVRLIKLFQKL